MASVLITGTSKGIGLEAALAFGRAGHQVHATMRNPSQSPELAETAAREKLPIAVSTMDVDSDQSVSHAIAAIQKEHGPIDVLVNNAGVERVGSVEELPFADFRAVMETYYFGALRCIQALTPHMRQRRSGCIINVTSVAGRIASAPMAPYTAQARFCGPGQSCREVGSRRLAACLGSPSQAPSKLGSRTTPSGPGDRLRSPLHCAAEENGAAAVGAPRLLCRVNADHLRDCRCAPRMLRFHSSGHGRGEHGTQTASCQ